MAKRKGRKKRWLKKKDRQTVGFLIGALLLFSLCYSPIQQAAASPTAPDESAEIAGRTDTTGLQPEFKQRVDSMLNESNGKLKLDSGLRTRAEQEVLYAKYKAGGTLAAKPGTSNHEKGLAADISGDPQLRIDLAKKNGLYFPVHGEPWHIEMDPKRSPLKTRGPPSSQGEVVAQAAYDAGFRGDGLVKAIAVSRAESSFNPQARLWNKPQVKGDRCARSGSTDRGAWQINDCYHAEVSTQCADNPKCAAKEVFRISGQGKNWTPWVTVLKGMDKQFKQQAEDLAKGAS